MPGSRPHLASILDDFDRHGSTIAVVATRGVRRHTITYTGLARLARRFASELEQQRIRKGDRVVIWSENGPEWIASFFGCVLRGVLPVPLDFASTPDFVRRVSVEVSPKLIVGDREKLAALALEIPKMPFDDFEHLITRSMIGAIEGIAESDALQIVFTSGTTGEPKGVVHTHRNVLASLRPIEQEIQKYLKYERLFHPIRFLHTLPLSHVFGQFMGLWIPPLIAAEVHFESRLVANELIDRIREQRISVLASVPRVLELLQQHFNAQVPALSERINGSEAAKAWVKWWRFRDIHRSFGFKFWAFVCGGASLPARAEQFWNSLGFVVVQGYGMTETTALVSLNHPFRAARGTIGQVLPGREVRLSDEGEVLVRGETISNTTWQDGEFRKQDSEWLATGDLAEFDESGNLRFRGRKKDVIVTSAGLNIYPEDLEAALMKQPGVKACAVIEADSDHGPEPLAVLVLTAGSAPRTIEMANQELAGFQRMHRWIEWPDADLPRTSTGKIVKREIVERLQSGGLGRSDLTSSESENLSLDSLGRVELQARLEQQYGISLDDVAIQQVRTTEDVRRLVAQQSAAGVAPSEPAKHVYPHWPWNPVLHCIRIAFLELVAMPLVRLLANPRVECRVKQWPSTPMLIVANHVTSYDVPLILFALPARVRDRIAVAMSGEMILDWRRARNQGHWFFNLLAPLEYYLVTALFNIFPLPQLSGFRRSFKHAGEAVDGGYSIIVFPEGRRSDDGTPQPFKSGAGLLWKELALPALAVRLCGLGEIKAKHSRWFRKGTISVHVSDILPNESPASPEERTRVLERAVFDSATEMAAR